MQEDKNGNGTYTYTARSIEDPNKVVTFTLFNEHMRINLTGVLEGASSISAAEDKPSEIKEQISSQAKPATVKLVENVSGPVHISDVDAKLEADEFRISLWQRLAGLRLAPVVFDMGQIDNLDAAEAFVDQLYQRKDTASHRGKFFGPLDYWLGWAGLAVLTGLLIRWPGKRNKS
jgi:hypothetical protein